MIHRIDISSIKPNPNAGRKSFLVPGKSWTEVSEDGKTITTRREVQRLYSMIPDPPYLFKYEPLEVECKECHAKFQADDLEDDWEYWGDESFHYEYGCPKCHTPNCCEKITLETVEEALKRKANENHSS